MNGLRGRPASWSSWRKELNGLPDGSRETRSQICSPSAAMTSARVNTLLMLWTENRTSASPMTCTSPSHEAIAIPNWCGSTDARPGMYSAGRPRPTSGAAASCARSSASSILTPPSSRSTRGTGHPTWTAAGPAGRS